LKNRRQKTEMADQKGKMKGGFLVETSNDKNLEDCGYEDDEDVENQDASSTATDPDPEVSYANGSSRGAYLVSLLIAGIGLGASGSFLYLGISSAKHDESRQFEQQASLIVGEVTSSWNDYEVAGLWTHEATRARDTSREEFRDLYYHLISEGLEFQAASYIPNVTLEEREEYENVAREYYAKNYPNMEYSEPFKGVEPVEGTDEVDVQPRSEQPFYFPVYYIEPVTGNEAAINFDLFSSAARRAAIESALTTWTPALSDRLDLVQETDESAYSVILFHPGIPIPDDPDLRPRDLSSIVIRIPDLLQRTARAAVGGVAVYLFATSSAGTKDFIGAAEFRNGRTESEELNFVPETEYEDVQRMYSSSGPRTLFYEEQVQIANQFWSIVVVPLEGEYDASVTFVALGGVIIGVATLALAMWLFVHNTRKAESMKQIVAQAETEKYIVSSLYPSNVRERLLNETNQQRDRRAGPTKKIDLPSSGMAGRMTSESLFGSKPIADLFPEATIMFADMKGFTAWSSAREPEQVFTLLEIVYHSFDVIANKLKIFKVETVGDSYVAVCGIPNARKDHAVQMARFATKCLAMMRQLSHSLQATLGPDTADLTLRIGLNSGPVTAGVLRGLKGRFQLFGDAMNTASRMESTGVGDRIQVSEHTAKLLRDAGKEDWLIAREDKVMAKGKGEMQTSWLCVNGSAITSDTGSIPDTSLSPSLAPKENESKMMDSLVEWNVGVLGVLLQKITANRRVSNKKVIKVDPGLYFRDGKMLVLDEVQDVISFPQSEANALETTTVELDPVVSTQLKDYVRMLSLMYHANPFHNFVHASHVTMSVTKLLSRLEGGTTTDPLTRFACVLAALVHDVDHPGLTNALLVQDGSQLATLYKNKSVAEQNSVDVAWRLLMGSEFEKLRECIYADEAEFLHFRQVLVNVVMATDIMDKELNGVRRARWETAFSSDNVEKSISSLQTKDERVNRKATIVIEHLVVASDVAHTMQHWHVYAKWNEKLFHEMRWAYKKGRLDKDPAEGWYEGEKGFFDFYIIPLAKKLGTCGVFGVSSHEYLDYALRNRKEWEEKGQDMVKSYLKSYTEKYES
jgi:class 3 adenylate cyclase